MRPANLVPAVLALSAAVIAGAFWFEYGLGLKPCELCLEERLPWYAAGGLAALLLILRRPALTRWAPALFAIVFLASAGLGLYHVGVEQHVLAGPAACTAPPLKAASIEELTRQILATPAVRCDEPQWSLFGVSLAGWNAAASVFAVVLAARAWSRAPREAAA
jgi:disulfide bond formation protein DsbB